ncbi:hypothetical protein [Rheinheimera sp.]|uniref:hypothetical protein n=1 Tax=Rheinheimera sp. TaxID=1869214 RepID=UPI00307E288B
MSDFDFDLDHLDFDAAEQKTNAEQHKQQQAQLAEQHKQQQAQLAELAELQDGGDDCAGGACKI